MTHPDWSRSSGLWSLWDMLTLDAEEFVQLFHTLFITELKVRGQKGVMPSNVSEVTTAGAEKIAGICRNLELPVSERTALKLGGCRTAEGLHAAITQITNTICIELEGREFYGPLSALKKYYDQSKLFGDEVFNNFPSANDDIYEAGMCLALERGTACVMHLMRAQEIALSALAAAVSVSKQNDWGGYIREIGKALDASAKASGARSLDEQFYAEAALNFDRLRRAWRNPSMHPEKTYSVQRAEEILTAMRSFMLHLATRLSE